MSSLTDIPLKSCVGVGSGLDAAGIAHKLEVLEEVLAHAPIDRHDPKAVLTYFAGYEMIMASGVVAAYPLIRSAVLMMEEMTTFTQASVDKYFS